MRSINRKFVRYDEGARMYGLSMSRFRQLVKDAGAAYKLNGQLVLINIEILDNYLERFRKRR